MPLPNNDFQWRPNDQSGITNIRYRIEAQKWYDSIDKIHSSNLRSLGSIKSSYEFVNAVIGLIFCILLLMVLGFLKLLTIILGTTKETKHKYPTTPKTYKEELNVLRKPERENYRTEDEYLDALGNHIYATKGYPTI